LKKNTNRAALPRVFASNYVPHSKQDCCFFNREAFEKKQENELWVKKCGVAYFLALVAIYVLLYRISQCYELVIVEGRGYGMFRLMLRNCLELIQFINQHQKR